MNKGIQYDINSQALRKTVYVNGLTKKLWDQQIHDKKQVARMTKCLCPKNAAVPLFKQNRCYFQQNVAVMSSEH